MSRRTIILAAILTAGSLAVGVFWYANRGADISPVEGDRKLTGDNTAPEQSGQLLSGAGAVFTQPMSDLVGSAIIGAPTDTSVQINILADKGMEAVVEYGMASGNFEQRTETATSAGGEPIVISLTGLKPDTRYYYRVGRRAAGSAEFADGTESSFMTQRAPGSTFSFGVQGDSHPERAARMFNSELYVRTMGNVARAEPDLYFALGDQFSIDPLIEKGPVSPQAVNDIYLLQRKYLGIIGGSTPLFLANGNHEQAAKYLLDGTADNPAVYAARARAAYYPLCLPNGFYSGDTEQVEHVGYLGDYYAFGWGDALFVVIDPYWHSSVAVDNTAGDRGGKRSDLWDITLGDAQYRWFQQTLENSRAKYKFVFAHHVLGTGRGGIENARLYEWGGYGKGGAWEFDEKRPGWEMPIHQLMVKNKVTIFFQGHDHLFAKQELDGVVYQEVPNPADDTYTAFNREAYRSGDTLPNSGFLNVTVSPQGVKVDYIRSFLPQDESGQAKNGVAAYSYTLK